MRRTCALLVLAAACSFTPPSPAGGGDDDLPPDAAEVRCDLDATWEQGLQPAQTLHVSTTPGPGAPDGSEANPFLALDDALRAAAPGTRIHDHVNGISGRELAREAPRAPWSEDPHTCLLATRGAQARRPPPRAEPTRTARTAPPARARCRTAARSSPSSSRQGPVHVPAGRMRKT